MISRASYTGALISTIPPCPAIPWYLTTSADGAFASGDAYIVYPGQGCVYPSIRGEITYQAIQDMRLCQALEERIGRDAVVSLIDKTAGRPLTFEEYPKTDSFFETLHDTMVRML